MELPSLHPSHRAPLPRLFKKLRALLAVVLTLLPITSTAADTWWNEKWPTRKKITVDTSGSGGNITEPIGGATILLRLYEANYPSTAKEDLTDLRFVSADDKTLYPHHIEKVDSLMGEAFVWVKLPEIAPNAKTTFWMYYGSSGPDVQNTQDPKGSYDAETALVFHFGESGSGASDVTKNGNAAEPAGQRAEGSCIGSGITLAGTNVVNIAPSPSLLWTDGAPLTIGVWVKPTTAQDAIVLSRSEGSKAFTIGIANGAPYVELNGQRATGAPQSITAGSWTHLAVVCEAAKTTLFVNGEVAGAVGAALPGMNTAIALGGSGSATARMFIGELDELQIHNAARPVGLAAFGQNGEKSSKVIVIGDPEEPKSLLSWLKGGYMGVILVNLTHDGWIVIILCSIMAVISWYIMVSKVRYLNAISKGNAVFMNQWRHVASDLTVLDSDDPEQSKTLGGRVTKENAKTLKQSAVYRIYHIGVDEIRHRLAADRVDGVRRGLAGRSIQAIRASLDGGMVRETQKLNKLVVILTICISGGPFLGLLGTVVGVMITFAAVAAAGEVNVNAIAPGIAAALLATVAGLGVAIPALFGYNYILSRVKDAKDDMHVFIDEFVTRMAEFYKEKAD
jgi:biopolymer transport protein ExbB